MLHTMVPNDHDRQVSALRDRYGPIDAPGPIADGRIIQFRAPEAVTCQRRND